MIQKLPTGITPSYYVGNIPEFFLLRLQAGLELIYCDQGAGEAFLNPIIHTLFNVNSKDKVGIKMRNELQEKTHILCVASRRKSRQINEPITKPAGSGNNPTTNNDSSKNFKKIYLLRYCGTTGSTQQQQHTALEALAQVSKYSLSPFSPPVTFLTIFFFFLLLLL
jgi:hypothetical protein